MTENATEAPAQEPGQQDKPAEPKDTGTDWQAEARKWEQRAKDNKKAADELEKQRKATMTEAERAVAEAEQRGRTAAVQEYGKRLATSEIRAVAATEGADLSGVFEYLDLSRFVGEDGEPDTKAIGAFVAGLPKKQSADPVVPSLDLGTRSGGPMPLNGDPLEQALRKKLGIS